MTVSETGSAWAETPVITETGNISGRGDAPVGTYITVTIYQHRVGGDASIVESGQVPSGQGGVQATGGHIGAGAYYTYVSATSGATARSEYLTI